MPKSKARKKVAKNNKNLFLVGTGIVVSITFLLLTSSKFQTSSPTKVLGFSYAATCTAADVACDPEFIKNKSLACGSFKDQAESEVAKTCAVDPATAKALVDEACAKGCPAPTIAPTSASTPGPTIASTPAPTSPAVPTPTPKKGKSTSKFPILEILKKIINIDILKDIFKF